MIAIQTKYLPATNARGSRIKAWTSGGLSATIPYPHHLSGVACHYEAVQALIQRHSLDWDISELIVIFPKNMRYGGNEKGYNFCFADSRAMIQRLANCVRTGAESLGHKKAHANERRASELRRDLERMGVEIPANRDLFGMGVFNGDGSC